MKNLIYYKSKLLFFVVFAFTNVLIYAQNKKPIPQCQQYLQVSLDQERETKVLAKTLDNGSLDPEGQQLYFKTLRVNSKLLYDGGCIDYNGDDDPTTDVIDVWYDDEVYFCPEEEKNEVMVSFRVFEKNPGVGAVNPDRMKEGGDLYNTFNDCWTIITLNPKSTSSSIIATCIQYKEVSINTIGFGKVNSMDFNHDSYSHNDDSLYYKVLRTKDKGCIDRNGDDDPTTDEVDLWFDESIYYCCEDVNNEIYNTLRVFDINPGNGAINPDRMKEGGDLYGHYSDCWCIVKVTNKVPPALDCPEKTVSCSESLNPDENPRLVPGFYSNCTYDIEYYDVERSDSQIIRKWTITTNKRSTSCEQVIMLPDTVIQFDPCSIVFPKNETVECANDLKQNSPTWDGNTCKKVSAKILKEDTTFINNGSFLKIIKEWAVIDWSIYKSSGEENNNDVLINNKLDCDNLVEDGFYKYKQVINIFDNSAPIINAYHVSINNFYTPSITAVATDNYNIEQKYNWKYIIHSVETGQPIQFSYNFTPIPSSGNIGDKTKDKLKNTKTARLYLTNDLQYGDFKVTWIAEDLCGNKAIKSQIITVEKIIDTSAPIPILVNEANVVLNDGFIDLKAISFDKGDCGLGCISSYDNFTKSKDLYFTFTENIPRIWENTSKWIAQYNENGVYYFNTTDGSISTKEEYLRGNADAWLKTQNTSQRRINCSDLDDTIKTFKIYVWDKFAYNTAEDYNNYDYGEVDVTFNNCNILSTEEDKNLNIKLYQNSPNPFDKETTISFSLPNYSKYKLSIYDTKGDIIYTNSGIGKKGVNNIKLNLNNFKANKGLYFYKLKTDRFVVIKKMVKL